MFLINKLHPCIFRLPHFNSSLLSNCIYIVTGFWIQFVYNFEFQAPFTTTKSNWSTVRRKCWKDGHFYSQKMCRFVFSKSLFSVKFFFHLKSEPQFSTCLYVWMCMHIIVCTVVAELMFRFSGCSCTVQLIINYHSRSFFLCSWPSTLLTTLPWTRSRCVRRWPFRQKL